LPVVYPTSMAADAKNAVVPPVRRRGQSTRCHASLRSAPEATLGNP
jgi:hypothetical protein